MCLSCRKSYQLYDSVLWLHLTLTPEIREYLWNLYFLAIKILHSSRDKSVVEGVRNRVFHTSLKSVNNRSSYILSKKRNIEHLFQNRRKRTIFLLVWLSWKLFLRVKIIYLWWICLFVVKRNFIFQDYVLLLMCFSECLPHVYK